MPPRNPPKRLTHFLCIPLVTPISQTALQTSLASFRSKITSPTPENPAGIPGAAVRPPGTIHLTLGVMSLLTQDRINGAVSFLRKVDLSALLASSRPAAVLSNPPSGETGAREEGEGTRRENEVPLVAAAASSAPESVGLEITLRGLESTHDPSQTSILYAAPLDSDGSLYTFCNRLRSIFLDAGFLIPGTRPLLLHATLLNTIYVPGIRGESGDASGGAGHGGNRARMVIDARGMLETFKEWTWVESVRIEKVAICRMGAQRVRDVEGNESEDEMYVIEGEVKIP
jgi:activating signal cointegrator complex subunit 1